MPSGSPLAAHLSNGEVGYYTAVATAIPVLLVAYLVGVQGFLSDKVGPRIETIWRNQALQVFDWLRDAEKPREGAQTLGYTLALLLYQAVGFGLLLAAVVLPATGEIAALQALFGGSPNSELRWLSEVGIAAAGIVVLFPLALRVLRVTLFSSPLLFIMGELLLTLLLTRLLATSWKPLRLWVIDPDVRLVYVGGDGITTFRGSGSLDEFASLAWVDGHQQAGSLLPINEREVLVCDAEADPPRRLGATRYVRRGFRLVRLVSYSSAQDAGA
jgi:hypothetical protein